MTAIDPPVRLRQAVAAPAHVFILCPPYCGSTVLWKLVATSSAVSALPTEGQFIPEVREVMRHEPWNPGTRLPWQRIKEVWEGYWDPARPLRVEKSPPHIIRAAEIIEHFSPVYFLLMVRNPYAHCEGLMRRNRWSAEAAAEFAARCLDRQAENARSLPHTIHFTYEQLVADPAAICRRIDQFVPGMGTLDHSRKFSAHSIAGKVDRTLTDFNRRKLSALSTADITTINRVFEGSGEAMAFFGYGFWQPSLRDRFERLRWAMGKRAGGAWDRARRRVRAWIGPPGR